MRFSDMHVHSTFSSDGKSSMNEHCEIAKQKKLKSICFTEHVDLTRLLRYRQIKKCWENDNVMMKRSVAK